MCFFGMITLISCGIHTPTAKKSQVFSLFQTFHTYVQTQFGCRIKSFQCDEFTALIKNDTLELVPRPPGVIMMDLLRGIKLVL